MEAPLFASDTIQPLFGLTNQTDKNVLNHEIIEISSDEDENPDDGQPESSRRAVNMSPSTKRTITVYSDDEDDNFDYVLGSEFNSLYPFLQSPRTKRPRLDPSEDYFDHLEPLNDANSPMATSSTGSSRQLRNVAFTQLTGFDSSFDENHGGNGHAKLAFRNLSDTEPGMTMLVNPPSYEPILDQPVSPEPLKNGNSKLETAPYYHDEKLNIKMYCGPGYEKFPIVLGTFPEHYTRCDEWDLQQYKERSQRNRQEAYRNQLAQYANDVWDNEQNTKQAKNDDFQSNTSAEELECLQKVREILPDIARDFALRQIREHLEVYKATINNEVEIKANISVIVSLILEVSDYPRQDKSKREGEPATDGTGVTIEWSRENSSGKTYQRDATCLLATQFDRVPTHFIAKAVQEKKTLFDCFLYLNDLEMRYPTLPRGDRPYHRFHNPRVALEKKYSCKEANQTTTTQWKNLVNELQSARQHVEREFLRLQRERENKTSEDANLQAHIASGNIVECQCCFDEEIPLNRVVSCEGEDMHWFCFECISKLAENQIGSMKHEMLCMHQNGCKARLSRNGIRCAIPKQLFDKLEFFLQQFEISAAGIEGLEQCPFCDFKAICDPVTEVSIFQCHNPDCNRVTCRMCHEDNHLPKTCEEAKTDKHISARHQIEEARSEAMIRKCPRCGVKIVKEMGCNKMRCGRCACVMCYVCKTDISGQKDGGYAHFNQTGAKCTLYDKEFDRHEAEANAAEQQAIRKVRAQNSDIDEEELQIETGKAKKVVPKADELGYGWGRALHEPAHRRQQAVYQRQLEAMRQHQETFQQIYRRMMENHHRARDMREAHNHRPGHPRGDRQRHQMGPVERVREMDRPVEQVRLDMNAFPIMPAMPALPSMVPLVSPAIPQLQLPPPYGFGHVNQQDRARPFEAMDMANPLQDRHTTAIHNAWVRDINPIEDPFGYNAEIRPVYPSPFHPTIRQGQDVQFGTNHPRPNASMGQLQPRPNHAANWRENFATHGQERNYDRNVEQPPLNFMRPWDPFEGLFNRDENNAPGVANWDYGQATAGSDMPANVL